MKRYLLVVALAVLAISAQPAAAQNASAVASEHTTFGTGSAGEPSPTQLTDMVVLGSNDDASVVAGPRVSYSPVSDEGDGLTDNSRRLAGDTSADSVSLSGLRISPSVSGSIKSLTVNVTGTEGSDYGVAVDIYIISETPDQTYNEGTKIGTWNPDWSPGPQTISLSQPPSVSAGTDYTLEFVPQSSDGDGTADYISVGTDASASSTWMTQDFGFTRSREEYPDITAEIKQDFDTATYIGAPHDAGQVTSGWANLSLQNASATATWQQDADADGAWTNVTSTTVSSTTNVTQDLSGTTSDGWRLRVDFEATGSNPVAEIHDEGLLFEPSSPTLSNPEPPDEVKIANATGDVSINVSDADFGLSQGDSITVSATDDEGNSIGSTTLTSNGTASFAYTSVAGENVIEWTATDSYGNTETFTHAYTTPATLTLYNETSPEDKISTTADITATFFGEDGETVVERTSSDATFNFSGLPADTEYIVTIDAKGYRERTLVVSSLYKQQSFYLLADNVDASQIVFELSDPTGEFPPGETRLYIEKPITINGSTKYRTVAADTFGATSAYSVVLADGSRYRLRIRHDGQERILGSYTPTVPTTEPLRVQRIEPSADDVPQGSVYGGVENGTLAVRFRGGEADTTVQYRVTADNGTVVVPDTETTGASFAHLYPVNNSTAQSYNVSYTISYGDGTARSGSFVAGGVSGIADRFNMDPQLLSLLSWFAIMAALGLVVIVDKRLAPAAGTGMASALTIMGTVAIPAPLLGVSGVVAVLALFGRPG